MTEPSANELLLKEVGYEGQNLTDILKNKKLTEELVKVLGEAGVSTKTEKSVRALLADTAGSKYPKEAIKHRPLLAKYIASGKIKSPAQFEAAVKHLKANKDSEISIETFEKDSGVGIEITEADIINEVKAAIAANTDELNEKRYQAYTPVMSVLKAKLPFADGALLRKHFDEQILALLGPRDAEINKAVKPKQTKAPKADLSARLQDDEKPKIAETITFPDPHDNKQDKEALLKEHIARTGGVVVTRFPPEPNGYLHIGHAKAMNLSFGYAKKMGGKCYLRFDDTNPEKESIEYIESIIDTVGWMGHKPWKITYASDYMDQLYNFAVELIKKDKAFVCHQTAEEIKRCRMEKIPSPWRDRPIAESLKLFEDMKKGKFDEGAATLRLKMDMNHENTVMRDLIAYRIKYVPHPHIGEKWCIYPSYDYTHCINDSLEDITHSLCTLEFEVRRQSYFWLLEELGIYKPVVWEYGRLNLTNCVLSKRRLIRLVEDKYVSGWDDPRMPTIVGYRRRGFTPEAINTFCEDIGVTRNTTVTIDFEVLENHVREHLNILAPRVMAVMEPLKVVITNWTGPVEKIDVLNFPGKPEHGTHTVPLSNVVYIERSDFKEEDVKNFFGLALKTADNKPKWVGLKYAYPIAITDAKKDANGRIVELSAICEKDKDAIAKMKLKGHLHWVAQPEVGKEPAKIEVRLYDKLFKSKNPGSLDDWLGDLNPHSRVDVHDVFIDPHALVGLNVGSKLQFERHGYFCVDPDTKDGGHYVFNRTVSLKESKDKPK
jgi:glutaminyl-tRNA synthetase